MSYHRCPECGLTVQKTAGRFAATSCPKCSVPLQGADQLYNLPPGPTTISRCLCAEPQAAATAREALEILRSELDPTQFHVAALLTTELIANAVEHAGMGPRGEVRFEAAITQAQIRVAVGDEGAGFAAPTREADAPLDSHWGLYLVDQLADRWGVLTEPRTLVWFELERSVASQMPVTAGTRHEASAPC
jgi:anti-sigma regulatory factor (Ser/Thr protein kinase)